MTFKWKNSLKCHKVCIPWISESILDLKTRNSLQEMHLRKNESSSVLDNDLRQLTYATAAKRTKVGHWGDFDATAAMGDEVRSSGVVCIFYYYILIINNLINVIRREAAYPGRLPRPSRLPPARRRARVYAIFRSTHYRDSDQSLTRVLQSSSSTSSSSSTGVGGLPPQSLLGGAGIGPGGLGMQVIYYTSSIWFLIFDLSQDGSPSSNLLGLPTAHIDIDQASLDTLVHQNNGNILVQLWSVDWSLIFEVCSLIYDLLQFRGRSSLGPSQSTRHGW